MMYAFKSISTASGNIECTSLVKDLKTPDMVKKAPKYSKDLEIVNSGSLTASDEEYLEKKALLGTNIQKVKGGLVESESLEFPSRLGEGPATVCPRRACK
jgi:hypothetical protein